jgi:hypothetical protein
MSVNASPASRLAITARRWCGVKPTWQAHVNACCLRPGAAFTGAGLDQFALELGQAAQDGQHQPTVGRGGVGPRIGQ